MIETCREIFLFFGFLEPVVFVRIKRVCLSIVHYTHNDDEPMSWRVGVVAWTIKWIKPVIHVVENEFKEQRF